MKTLRYAKRLIEFNTSSHLTNRAMIKYLEIKLAKHGFIVEKVAYRDAHRVSKYNLIAKKGTGRGGLAFFAHSDTVPAPEWFTQKFTPFQAALTKDRLYGRGACDMKGALACMLTAAQFFEADELEQPLYIVVTADEEVGHFGARCVVDESKFYRDMVAGQTKGVIGEPTGLEVVHAHKGSYRIRAAARGKAGHSGTQHGVNANLAMIPFLSEMKAIHDETERDARWLDSRYAPPSLCWNIGINDYNPAVNVTAAKSICTVYFRPMPGMNIEPLLERTRRAAEAHGLALEIDRWGEPLYTPPEGQFVRESLTLAHRTQSHTVPYGTDGGAFTELENLIVLGPGSIEQAHAVDEWISVEQLSHATELYTRFIRRFCCEPAPSPVAG